MPERRERSDQHRDEPKGPLEQLIDRLLTGTEASEPEVSGGPGGTWAVTSTRFVPEQPYVTDRVFLRVIAPK